MGKYDAQFLISITLLFQFLDILGASLVVPLLPEAAKQLGASPTTAVLINSSLYGLLQTIGSPVSGWMSDRFGRRWVLLLSCVATAGAYVVLAMANSIPMLVLSRIPVGLMKQSMTLCSALITDLSTPQSRASMLARLNAAVAVGFVVGPAMGGQLHALGGHSIALPALIAAATFALLGAIVFVCLPSDIVGPDGNPIQRPSPKEMTRVGKDGKEGKKGGVQWARVREGLGGAVGGAWLQSPLVLLFAGKGLVFFAVTVVRSTLSVLASDRFDLSPKANGYLLSYVGGLGIVAQFLLSRSQHAQHGQVTMLGLSEFGTIRVATWVLMASMVALLLAPSVAVVFLVMVPMTVAQGIVQTLRMAAITRAASSETVGQTLGYNGVIDSVVRFIAPTLSAFVIGFGGFSALAPLVAVPLMATQWLLTRSRGAFPREAHK